MIRLLDRFLLLQPRWLSTILFIPLLYALGWLAAMLLTVLGLPYNDVSLTGTVLSFVLFVLAMPRWAAKRWSVTRAWTALGICNGGLNDRRSSAVGFLQGLLIATGLLTIITTLALIGGWGQWLGNLDIRNLLNALLLCFGVGLAEELIFRGWLWAELNQSIGAARGFIAQAVVFSLVHTRFNLNLPEKVFFQSVIDNWFYMVSGSTTEPINLCYITNRASATLLSRMPGFDASGNLVWERCWCIKSSKCAPCFHEDGLKNRRCYTYQCFQFMVYSPEQLRRIIKPVNCI